MRYYSKWRPLGPGCFPSLDTLIKVVNFPEPKFVKSIGREAIGYVEYAEPLPDDIAACWELIPDGVKPWYCVTSSFDDRGITRAAIVKHVEAKKKPSPEFKQLSTRDVYSDWFGTFEAASQFVEQVIQVSSAVPMKRQKQRKGGTV